MAYDKIIDSTQLDADLTSVANAIRSKGGTTEQLEFPSGMVTAIESIQTGGGGDVNPTAQKGFVTFYDYDGTIRYSWTAAETAAATELPPLPVHDGLVCQGWNWSLADIKAMGIEVNVGAMYITDDGATRICVTLSEGRTSPMMGLSVIGTVTIDWGDGTEPDTLTGTNAAGVVWTPTHNYAAPGDYVIRIIPSEGTVYYVRGNADCCYLLRYASNADGRSKSYINAIKSIFLGTGVSTITEYSFCNLSSLESITIPIGTTTSIENRSFTGCYALASITIPSDVSEIVERAFQGCSMLASVAIPGGVTSIGNYAFNNCYVLASVAIPGGVTSIGNYAFNTCYVLASVAIPGGVTSIGGGCYNNNNSIKRFQFLPLTPPALGDTNVFNGVPADCVFEVPSGCLAAYQSATNYASIADRMVEATA